MSIVEVNWEPSPRQLRQFGIVCLFALPSVAWFWGGSLNVISILGIVGLAIALVSMLLPRLVKPLFVGLMLVTAPIGMVVGEFSMMLIYFLVLAPIGIFFRLTGRDGLRRSLDRSAPTYWQPKKQPISLKHYYRQS